MTLVWAWQAWRRHQRQTRHREQGAWDLHWVFLDCMSPDVRDPGVRISRAGLCIATPAETVGWVGAGDWEEHCPSSPTLKPYLVTNSPASGPLALNSDARVTTGDTVAATWRRARLRKEESSPRVRPRTAASGCARTGFRNRSVPTPSPEQR